MPAGGDGKVKAHAANDDGLPWNLRLADVDADGVGAAAVSSFDVRLDAVTPTFVVYVILPRELGQCSFGRVGAVLVGPIFLEVKFPGLPKAAFGIDEGGLSKCHKGAVDVVWVIVVGFRRGVPRTVREYDPPFGVSFSRLAGFLDRSINAGILDHPRRLLDLCGRHRLGLRALDWRQ